MAASTQSQALSALIFLDRHVLHQDLPDTIDAIRAKRPQRLPTVMTKEEARQVIAAMSGTIKSVTTSMIYTHVLNRGGMAVRSPLDA